MPIKILTIFRSKLVYTFLFLFLSLGAFAQLSIYEAGAEHDDRLDEWYIISEDNEEGRIETKWKLRDDWSEWEYVLGDKTGEILLKHDYEPNRWELRSDDGIVVQLTQAWRNDITEWKIECEGLTVKYEMPNKNDRGFWNVEDEDYGYLEMITLYERDYRDWQIYDELSEEVNFEMKIAMVFICILPSLPKG